MEWASPSTSPSISRLSSGGQCGLEQGHTSSCPSLLLVFTMRGSLAKQGGREGLFSLHPFQSSLLNSLGLPACGYKWRAGLWAGMHAWLGPTELPSGSSQLQGTRQPLYIYSLWKPNPACTCPGLQAPCPCPGWTCGLFPRGWHRPCICWGRCQDTGSGGEHRSGPGVGDGQLQIPSASQLPLPAPGSTPDNPVLSLPMRSLVLN